MIVAPVSQVMGNHNWGIIGNNWKLSAIVVALVCVVACATAPPKQVPSPPVSPPVDHSRLAEMHRKFAGGRNLCNKGEFEHAIRTLEPVWLWNPGYKQVASCLSLSLLNSGLDFYVRENYTAAIERWEKAIKIAPDNAKARRYLARARQELAKMQSTEND